jgi:tRNA threonylcarbamoyladenosine biosynthesis protein TsaB
MALILSIETSTSVCSIALHDEGKLIVSNEIYFERSHSGSLLSIIHNALKYAHLKIKDLSAIAISKGPGSYTGLRIGTSTAKGLCFSLDIPLISVNTLYAMAFGMNIFNTEQFLLCPMLDARRMEIYCMVLNENLEVLKETEALILTDNSFEAILKNKKVLFFGNGSDKAKNLLINNENSRFVTDYNPLAIHVGAIAINKFSRNEFENIEYFEPYYLKDFVGKKINTL